MYLARLEKRPLWLEKIAYGWCAVIWKNRQSCEDGEILLSLALEVGFRCFDPQEYLHFTDFAHTEHHRELSDAVFNSNESEAIADLLCALNMCNYKEPAAKAFGFCKQYIADLRSKVTAPFSPRLRQLVINSIALIGYKEFEEVGTEKFVGLLNHLHIGAEDVVITIAWTSVLLKTAQSPESHRHLAIQSWEFLVTLTFSQPWGFGGTEYTPHVTASLSIGGTGMGQT